MIPISLFLINKFLFFPSEFTTETESKIPPILYSSWTIRMQIFCMISRSILFAQTKLVKLCRANILWPTLCERFSLTLYVVNNDLNDWKWSHFFSKQKALLIKLQPPINARTSSMLVFNLSQLFEIVIIANRQKYLRSMLYFIITSNNAFCGG